MAIPEWYKQAIAAHSGQSRSNFDWNEVTLSFAATSGL
jgi:hypothetical protein